MDLNKIKISIKKHESGYLINFDASSILIMSNVYPDQFLSLLNVLDIEYNQNSCPNKDKLLFPNDYKLYEQKKSAWDTIVRVHRNLLLSIKRNQADIKELNDRYYDLVCNFCREFLYLKIPFESDFFVSSSKLDTFLTSYNSRIYGR